MKLRADLEEAQRLRVDVDELRQYCRQLEAESGRWKCRSCTFINQARNSVCEMCSVQGPVATSGGGLTARSREAGGYSTQPPQGERRPQDHGIVGLPSR